MDRLGWKAGFGTKAAMEMLGTSGPLAAPLTTSTLVADGAEVSVASWTKPFLEGEIAVRIGENVIAPAIELVDLDGPTDNPNVILERGIYHKAVVLGTFADVSPRGLTVDIVRNGDIEVEGADALALIGDLDEVLQGMDAEFEPGDIVITGATVPPIAVAAGDEIVVRLNGLGEVSVRLT